MIVPLFPDGVIVLAMTLDRPKRARPGPLAGKAVRARPVKMSGVSAVFAKTDTGAEGVRMSGMSAVFAKTDTGSVPAWPKLVTPPRALATEPPP